MKFTRKNDLAEVAASIQNMVRSYSNSANVMIRFVPELGESDIENLYLTPFQIEYFRIRECEDYFMIFEDILEDTSGHRPCLLYVVNVSGDSVLTAASELLGLVSKKF